MICSIVVVILLILIVFWVISKKYKEVYGSNGNFYSQYNDGKNYVSDLFNVKTGKIEKRNITNSIINGDVIYYYGLYWEEEGSIDVDFSEGFYVCKSKASKFLEEKLDKIGLTEREANEFIMYWLPILEKNEHNLVYFELTEERENYNKLLIEPKPDSLLRVAIHVKKVDKETNIKEQKLSKFKREGFTVVEWGGNIH